MTAHQFLDRYRAAKVDMQRAERLIAKIEALLEVRGVDTTSEKVQLSGFDDRTAGLIAELVDAKREYEEALERSVQVMREINGVIERVSDPQQKRLLELRYLDGKTWEEISNTIHVSYRHVFNIHQKAKESVEDLIC